ncbi:MAG: pitrilysin family protein [Cyclobacteriaceae bacterium]
MKNVYKILSLLIITLLASCQSGNKSEQGLDYQHPTEMGLEASNFKMPNPDDYKVTLDNGLTAFLVTGKEVPLVTVTAYIVAGTAFDDKAGVAETLASILKSGCSGTSKSFHQEADDLAAQYSVTMDQEGTAISLNVASEDVAWAIKSLSGIMQSPCITSQMVTAYKGGGVQRAINGRNAFDGNLNVAVGLFSMHLYEGHAYTAEVSSAQAAAVSVLDVSAFYKKYFTPSNITIGVGGDFDRAAVEQLLTDGFGAWSGGERPVIATAASIIPKKQTEEYTADKLQSWYVAGNALPVLSAEEIPALEVMNYILGGGHFDTRLYKETRDLRGLTNDASGFLTFWQYGPGSYDFRTYGRPEVLGQLEELVLSEINKIRNEEVSDEELMVAQGALADGVFEVKFENSHKTASTLAEEFNKYQSFERLSTYQERVRAVSKADVKEAANKYLNPDQFTTIKIISK